MFLLCKIWETQQFEELNTLMYSFCGCQHFVGNSECQPQSRLSNSGSTFSFSRLTATVAAQSRFPNVRVTNAGMSLDNTLGELSVSATLLTNRTDNEYQDLNNPDEATRLANKQVMWLVLTKEEVNKLKEAETTPLYFQSLHGSIGLPRWDKLIESTSPAAALATWYYHAVEQHVVTNQRTESVLLSWEVNTLQQMQRVSTGCINVFSRGHAYPQIQVEAGHAFNMLPSEKATQNVWNLQHVNRLSMSRTVGLFYTWGNGWAWTCNVPINIVEVAQTGPQHQLWCAPLQSLLYSGLQCLDVMPTATATLMKQHLGRQHHLMVGNIGQIQVKDIGYNGQKTAVRIRGATTWADSADIGQYNSEIEEYRRDANMDTSNMEEDEPDAHHG
eukprot:s349_g14.t1